MDNSYEKNWADIAFKSKKPLRDLKAIFIATPREISVNRFTNIIKEYLPQGNIIIGCADEDYITGFDGQKQFKTLKVKEIKPVVDKVNNSNSPHKVYLLHLRQNEVISVYEKIKFKKVLLVNGSWKSTFHLKPEYYHLVTNNIPFEYISPFCSEEEAIGYANAFKLKTFKSGRLLTEVEMLGIADECAYNSFANEFQTGVAIAKKQGDMYKLLATSFNQVVPYQTFAWHYGALREKFTSPQGDLNYYDTVHAEINLIILAHKKGIDLKDATLFINLLPCPHCARALCQTDIAEIVYSLDHSSGYAYALLSKSGKKVRRLLNNEKLIKEVE